MESAALQEFFRVDRGICNQLVASSRHQSPGLKTEDLDWFIFNCLDPLMKGLDQESLSVSFSVAQAGFRHGLELAALNWFNTEEKHVLLQLLWCNFYAEITPVVQQDPAGVFTDMANLLNHLFNQDSNSPNLWLKRMRAASAALTSITLLRKTGLVCAWMSGLAHYRQAALQQVAGLPDVIVRRLFELSDSQDINQHVAALEKNRWFPAERQQAAPLQLRARVGSCSLLDGEFPTPPQIFAFNDQFMVQSGDLAWHLYIDVFGSSLLICDIDELKIQISTDTRKQFKVNLNKVPSLEDINTVSNTVNLSDTLAITSPETFSILIFSRASKSQSEAGQPNG